MCGTKCGGSFHPSLTCSSSFRELHPDSLMLASAGLHVAPVVLHSLQTRIWLEWKWHEDHLTGSEAATTL